MKTWFPHLLFITLQLFITGCSHQSERLSDPKSDLSPDERYGELFVAVQTKNIFEDSKMFVDAMPTYLTENILADYKAKKNKPDFNLRGFVTKNFNIPLNNSSDFITDRSKPVDQHIASLWDTLTRQPDQNSAGSLIPLPHPYVVPGGRFREIYYWDSYFTMLGLQASGRWDLIENMVDNFSYLIDTKGFIPNGNRSYYLSRSQPPFFSLMVKLLEEKRGKGTLEKYKTQLLSEYGFWMKDAGNLSAKSPALKRVVLLPEGSVLNRYWDDQETPRPESYKEDLNLVETYGLGKNKFRDIRAAAESGWDFSSRWFKDGATMASIHTTDIIPVDLNALLYHLELVLAEAFAEAGDQNQAQKFNRLAQKRKQALLRYCWSNRDGFFYDYDFIDKNKTNNKSLAAMYPLYFNMVEVKEAERVAQVIERDFLKPGGVTTTINTTGQQWDAPNGWAPLQWITVQGLNNYHQTVLADTIGKRWVELNTRVYQRTGKLVEKYNVFELGLEGGGGEYPVQDGFGWTNGVLLRLLNDNRASQTSNVKITHREIEFEVN